MRFPIVGASLLALLLFSSAAYGQDVTPPDSDVASEPAATSPVDSEQTADESLKLAPEDVNLPERELNGHYFISMVDIPGPFITSHIETTTMVGYVAGQGQTVNGEMDLSYMTLTQGFTSQIGIADLVGLFGQANGNFLIAADEDTSLSNAVKGRYGFGGGLKLKVADTKVFQASILGAYDNNTSYNVIPMAAIDEASNQLMASQGQDLDMDDLAESMYTETSAHKFRTGAQMAFGVHAVGFWTSGTYENKTRTPLEGEPTNASIFRIGGGISLNFSRVTDVPLGFTGFFNTDIGLDYEKDRQPQLSKTFGGGIYYTGRSYADFGLEVASVTFDQNNADLGGVFGRTRLRVYF